MAHQNSTKWKLLLSAVAIEDLLDLTFKVNNKLINVTTKDSGGWEDFLPGLKGATFTGSLIVDDTATLGAEEILTNLISGTSGAFEASDSVSGNAKYTFSAYFNDFTKGGGLEDKITVNFSGTVTGAVTQGTVA